MVTNQNGNISFTGLLFCLIIFTVSLGLLKYKQLHLFKSKEISKSFLCTKKYTGLYKKHHDTMTKMNKALLLLNTSKNASLFIPFIGVVAAANIRNAETALKIIQNGVHVSYMKNIMTLFSDGCSFTPNIFKTAFVHNGLILSRDSFSRAKTRVQKWKVYYITFSQRLKIIHNQSTTRVFEHL